MSRLPSLAIVKGVITAIALLMVSPLIVEPKTLVMSKPQARSAAPRTVRLSQSYLILKRLFDMTVAAVLLFVLSPLMLAIIIAIRLDSSGGAIFAQERVGTRVRVKNGQRHWYIYPFVVYKFRTMRQDADSELHRAFVKALIEKDTSTIQQMQGDEVPEDTRYKLTRDPRVTRVGHWLRKTSLDELPQLWNVLKGDMSLVGPRPPLPYEVELYSPEHLRRLEAQPGLTGLWQVSARSAVDFDGMVALDVQYIEHQSFWEDLRIFFKTPLAVLKGRGAV
ncbi:MAG: sugar transferase [Chloroflexi bacterium]|nr:sugar transferase [Chloroflexota bacterium]